MEYDLETFRTVSNPSGGTKYRYCLSSAFYDVFTDGHGDYHMAREYRDSLWMRIQFYENQILYHPYPVFENNGVKVLAGSREDVLKQVLGLPDEMYYRKDPQTQKDVLLGTAEIFHRIRFEDGLFEGYGKIPPYLSPEEMLSRDDFAVTGAVNALVAKGFYLMDPSQIFSLLDPEIPFPIYVDGKLLRQEGYDVDITPEELLISFTINPTMVTREGFIREYQGIRNKSVEELAQMAFAPIPEGIDVSRRQLIYALRGHFFGIAREILNEYFERDYFIYNFLAPSVLKKNIGHDFAPCPYVACGRRFPLLAQDFRVVEEKDGQAVETFHPTNYALRKGDSHKLLFSYSAVHRFFEKNPQYRYLPALYVALMGLPYEAFRYVQYFDFENGTAEQFLACFPVVDSGMGFRGSYPIPLSDDLGLLVYGKGNDDLYFFLREKEGNDFYISNYFSFAERKDVPYFLVGKPEGSNAQDALAGSYPFYSEVLSEMEKNEPEAAHSWLPLLRAFLLADEKNGVLPTIQKFFDLLQEGVLSTEAAKTALEKNPGLDWRQFLLFVDQALLDAFREDQRQEKQESELPDFWVGEEVFYDPLLPLPYVHRGRYFLGYSEKPDSEVYLDEGDLELLVNLVSIFMRYFEKQGSFDYPDVVFNVEMVRTMSFTNELGLAAFLGVPISAVNSNKKPGGSLLTRKGISLFDRKDHQRMIAKDRLFRRVVLFRDALRKGYYSLSQQKQNVPLYCLEGKDERLELLENPTLLLGAVGLLGRASMLYEMPGMTLLTYAPSRAARLLLPYLKGDKPMEDEGPNARYSHLAVRLSGDFLYARMLEFAKERFPFEKRRSSLFFSPVPTEKGTVEVSYGWIFNAYRTGPEQEWALAEEDIPLLLKAFSLLPGRPSGRPSAGERVFLMETLGLPLVLFPSFSPLLLRKTLDAKALKKAVKVRKRPKVLEEGSPKANDVFLYEDCRMGGYHESSALRREALKEGLFVPTHQAILDDDAMDFQPFLSLDETEALRCLCGLQIVAGEPLSGPVKSYLLPRPLVYAEEVEAFLNFVVPKAGLSEDDRFYLKEMLMYLYEKDPRILLTAGKLISTPTIEKWRNHMKLALHGFRLPTIRKRSLAFTSFYVALFVFAQEQMAYYRISRGHDQPD